MRNWISKLDRRNIVVHLAAGDSIKGILIATHGDCVVLGHARALGADGDARALDGDVVIPREQVAFIQDLTGSGEVTA